MLYFAKNKPKAPDSQSDRQICTSADDAHVRDGQDSHENGDFIFMGPLGGEMGLCRYTSAFPLCQTVGGGNIHLVASLLAALG